MAFAKAGIALAGVVVFAGSGLAQPPVPVTKKDLFFHGSQPVTPDEVNFEFLREADVCGACHGDYTESQSPYERWRYSMMAQSYRDPVFHAAFKVAQKDINNAGEYCLRCHAPMGWFQNRANATGSTLDPLDFEGVSCSICHRAVDPEYTPGVDPSVDEQVLQALGSNRPPDSGSGGPIANGHMVIDPQDRRRGPFDLGQFFYHEFLQSNLHVTSEVCAACHDVSNPIYTKEVGPGGAVSYVPGTTDTRHPTGNKYDMFPVERLFSEWAISSFANGAVTQVVPDGNGGFVGRFGGNNVTAYSSCQDCHMPKVEGTGCAPFLGSPVRPNIPQHNFAGANTWVLRAVNDLFQPFDSRLENPEMIDASINRTLEMHQRASDAELLVVGDQLRVRIINETGHKLPSGYAEGRKMWINVRFFDSGGTLIAERGGYNPATGDLDDESTKVYEQKQGLDAAAAAVTGKPVGESFHFAVNNKVFKDNRIPPRGATNAALNAIQAPVVGYAYPDGQYWDDTYFTIPAGTASAQARVYFQTTTREYIEFLRDNATQTITPQDIIQPPAGSTATTVGQVVHEQWVKWGRSAPALMDDVSRAARACKPDLGSQGGTLGADGQLNNNDFIVFIDLFFSQNALADIGQQGGTAGSDGLFNNNDFIAFIDLFFGNCP